MAKQQTNSQQTRTDSYTTGTGWTVYKLGTLRIATKKLTWTSIANGSSANASITLPDSKTFNEVSLTSSLNNNGAYVETLSWGTQYGDTSTTCTMYVRNNAVGTTGKITITYTAIYEA
jgi:hypothetical protein